MNYFQHMQIASEWGVIIAAICLLFYVCYKAVKTK